METPPAKFFVNSGLVSTPTDMHHLLRPLLRQTVAYRYHRAGAVIAHGTGWVERVVVDQPDVSTYFTPLSISINVDSFEHLEFDTRPDQLLTYVLVQGDERVVLEFAPVTRSEEGPIQESFRFGPTPEYVQMELSALESGAADPGAEEGSGTN
ncbi:MAG: hypothetical protein ABIZ34_06320 [Candidatus Limnocylindrales bacterium]